MGESDHASVQGKKRTMWYERKKPNPVNYAKNCGAPPNWQKHHILPVTSVYASLIAAAKDKENLEKAVKYFTIWNINDGHNLMPLPTRTAYQKLFGKLGGRQGIVGTLGNFPCHQPTSWGHTDYNDKVNSDLKKVWAKVSISIENHKLSANDISGDLSAVEAKWKATLASGRIATIANWRAMVKGTPGAHNHFTMVRMKSSPF